MEEYIVREITRELKWYEKIVVKVFKRIAVKVYNCARISTINAIKK